MESTMVYKLYTFLNKKEVREFDHWLKMVTNKPQKLIWLFSELDKKDIKKEQIIEKIIKSTLFKKQLDEKKAGDELRRLSKEGKAHLSDFLAYQGLKKKANKKDILFLEEIQHRSSPDAFDTFWQNKNKRLNKETQRNAEYFRTLYEMGVIAYEYQREVQKDKRKRKLNDIHDSFDLCWAHEKFVLILAEITLNSFQPSKEIRPDPLTEICLEILKKQYDDSPFMQEFLISLSENNEAPSNISQFLKKISLSDEITQVLDRELLANLFNFLYNSAVIKTHQIGDADAYSELSDVLIWGLNQRILFNSNQLILNHYDNILAALRHAGRLKEALMYTESLRPNLLESIQDEAYEYNYGLYLFYNKEFSASKEVLSQTDFIRTIYNVQSRYVISQIEYELIFQKERPYQDMELLIQPLSTLYEYIRTQKGLTQSFQRICQDKVRLSKKLMESYYPNELRSLREEVIKDLAPSHRKWLLEKIDERLI